MSTDGGKTFTPDRPLHDVLGRRDLRRTSPRRRPNTVVINAPAGNQCGTYTDVVVWTDTDRGAGFKTGAFDVDLHWWADGISTHALHLEGRPWVL